MESDLWVRLTLEGRFDLIDKLNRVENKEPGYGTVIVPQEGFSSDDGTHNLVIDWLNTHGINVLNVGFEVSRLENSLHGYKEL